MSKEQGKLGWPARILLGLFFGVIISMAHKAHDQAKLFRSDPPDAEFWLYPVLTSNGIVGGVETKKDNFILKDGRMQVEWLDPRPLWRQKDMPSHLFRLRVSRPEGSMPDTLTIPLTVGEFENVRGVFIQKVLYTNGFTYTSRTRNEIPGRLANWHIYVVFRKGDTKAIVDILFLPVESAGNPFYYITVRLFDDDFDGEGGWALSSKDYRVFKS